jgi:dTMP kinase
MMLAPDGSAGRLIVFEGVEGAGKTTQAARLADAVRRPPARAVIVREPGATWLGEKIRGLLLDAQVDINPRAEALLFLAARAQLVVDIQDHLAEGKTVIADRFFLSTYAYQIAGRGLPSALVRSANQLAVGGLTPDLTVVLVYPADAGLARKGGPGTRRDRIERAGVDFHERVAAAFRGFLTSEWQGAHPECGPVIGIDAAGTESEVAARVAAAVTERWPGMVGSDARPGETS